MSMDLKRKVAPNGEQLEYADPPLCRRSSFKWRQISPNVSWHSEQIHEIFFPTSTVPLARINSTILKVPSTDHVVGDGIAAIDTLALGVRHPGHAHMVQDT